MILDVVSGSALRAAALTGLVWLGMKALRVRNPHTRMAAWRAMLAASLAMPLLMQLQVVVADAPQLALPASITTLPALPSVTVSMQPGAGVTPTSIDLGAMLTTIYLVIAAALVMRLAIGLVRTWRLRQAATPVSAAWTEGADVRVSSNLLVPVAFASTILLPETYTSWSADKRRAVMAHESGHVRQGDFLILLLAALNKAIFWFNPAAWLLEAELAGSAEDGSDSAAVAALQDRFAYAEILVGVASRFHALHAAVPMARSATISRRVSRILSETRLPASISWQKAAMISAAVLAPAIVAGRAVAYGDAQSAGAAVQLEDQSEHAIEQRRYEQARPRHQVPIDPALLDFYVGQYEIGEGAIFTITRQGDQLLAQLTGQPSIPVYPDSDHEFFYKIVPAQLTFLPGGHQHATGLVLHQNGYDQFARRLDAAEVQKASDTLAAQIKANKPAPGSEAALRKMIEDEQRGQPDYTQMGPQLAQAVKAQLPVLQSSLAALGTLQSLQFTGVSEHGADMYEVRFANGNAKARIKIAPDGHVTGMIIQGDS
jgi:beta-lactamase regulating signal transducer with metallopeptidase domain